MWRVRVEGELLVLQVYDPPSVGNYYDRYEQKQGTWRDAKVQDIPVTDPFRRDVPQPDFGYAGSQESRPSD